MKILSIDFDAIMFPCIKLYNEYCAGDQNATEIWNRIEFERDILQYLKYDANIYSDIFNLIIRNLKNGAKMVPIHEHQELVDHLKKYYSVNDPLDITNIDYHHDIAYNKESLGLCHFHDCSCANWGGYLMLQNEKTTFHWIKCPGSTPYDNNICNFPNKITIGKYYDIPQVADDYDIIYFCLSPQWVPYQFHHLYNIIVSISKLLYPDNFLFQEKELECISNNDYHMSNYPRNQCIEVILDSNNNIISEEEK